VYHPFADHGTIIQSLFFLAKPLRRNLKYSFNLPLADFYVGDTPSSEIPYYGRLPDLFMPMGLFACMLA
jgi:hypothetical protein